MGVGAMTDHYPPNQPVTRGARETSRVAWATLSERSGSPVELTTATRFVLRPRAPAVPVAVITAR